MDDAQNEDRWQQLLNSESEDLWNQLEVDLVFRPYSKPKIKPAGFTVDVRRMIDGLGHFDAINLIQREIKRVIDKTWPHAYAYFLDWHHVNFKSKIDADFEYFYCIDFPANGDYVFLVLDEIDNVIFSDGIEERLYFFGESLTHSLIGDSMLAQYAVQE